MGQGFGARLWIRAPLHEALLKGFRNGTAGFRDLAFGGLESGFGPVGLLI